MLLIGYYSFIMGILIHTFVQGKKKYVSSICGKSMKIKIKEIITFNYYFFTQKLVKIQIYLKF